MRIAFLFISLLIGFSAMAADRKIGNVIVVERDLDNVFDLCMEDANRKPDALSKVYMSCFIQILKHPGEILLNKGTALKLDNAKCDVFSDFGGNGLLIFFNPKGKDATRNDAIQCLREALSKNTDMIATVQTIE